MKMLIYVVRVLQFHRQSHSNRWYPPSRPFCGRTPNIIFGIFHHSLGDAPCTRSDLVVGVEMTLYSLPTFGELSVPISLSINFHIRMQEEHNHESYK